MMATAGERAYPATGNSAQQIKARTRRLESEHQRLSERVCQLEDELARARDFAALAAHEVIKPLVMTEACADGIRERTAHALDIVSRQELESIIHVSASARMLVEALLIDARDCSIDLPRRPVDLTKVVHDCLAMLGPDIAAREAEVEVDSLPVVSGNAAMLRGVFGNLLANAIKYGPGHGSRIRVTAVLAEGSWVLSVEGPGTAIPDAERRSIFEPWRRGTTGRGARGVGLGLAVARRIVERHGGELGVTSPDAKSNRFFFTLPA
jgi:signal transduction histidine kinase